MSDQSQLKLYLSFIIIFLIFHGIGIVAKDLPYILNALITFTVVFISLLQFDKWYSNVSYSQVIINLGFHKTSLRKIYPGILISIFLLLLYPAFYFLPGFKIYPDKNWILNLTGLCLTGGLAEEMFFRGFLFRHLRDKMNFKKAALTSMMLFAAVHLVMFTYMDWAVALFSTILAVAISLPLSYLFEIADNTVWSPAIVHTTIRTIGLVISAPESSFMQMTLFWMIGCMVIPFIILFFSKDFRRIWKESNASVSLKRSK